MDQTWDQVGMESASRGGAVFYTRRTCRICLGGRGWIRRESARFSAGLWTYPRCTQHLLLLLFFYTYIYL